MYEHAACERSITRVKIIKLIKMFKKAISEEEFHLDGNSFFSWLQRIYT